MAVRALLPSHRLLAVDEQPRLALALEIRLAEGALGVLCERIPAVGYMPAIAEHLDSVGVGELDRVVVEYFANILADADLPAARPLGLDGMRLGDPIAHVDVVNVLLDDVIAAQPVEIVPVADLILHFRLARLAFADPHAVGVEIHAHELQFADSPVVNPLDQLEVFGLVAQMMSDGHGQLFLLRLFVGRHHPPHADRIGGHGLLQEDVLARLHRGLELCTAENQAAYTTAPDRRPRRSLSDRRPVR